MLGGHVGVALELLVEVDDEGGEDGEQRTETEDDDVADGLGEGGVALEVTRLAGVIGEGGDELICEPIDDGLRRHGGDGLISFVLTLLLLLLRQFGRMRSKIKAACAGDVALPLVVTFLVAWPARDFSLGARALKPRHRNGFADDAEVYTRRNFYCTYMYGYLLRSRYTYWALQLEAPYGLHVLVLCEAFSINLKDRHVLLEARSSVRLCWRAMVVIGDCR